MSDNNHPEAPQVHDANVAEEAPVTDGQGPAGPVQPNEAEEPKEERWEYVVPEGLTEPDLTLPKRKVEDQ